MTRMCASLVALSLLPAFASAQTKTFSTQVPLGAPGVPTSVAPPRDSAEPGKPLEILDGQTVEKVDFALPR